MPHTAVLFFLLIALVMILSAAFSYLGTSVTYQRMNPDTYKAEVVTT